jgi:hypothetical protein
MIKACDQSYVIRRVVTGAAAAYGLDAVTHPEYIETKIGPSHRQTAERFFIERSRIDVAQIALGNFPTNDKLRNVIGQTSTLATHRLIKCREASRISIQTTSALPTI